MIVTCPECRTRYRYPQEDPAGPVRCRCSRCESTFVAGDVARSYLVAGEAGQDRPHAGDAPAPFEPALDTPPVPAATPVVPSGEVAEQPAGLSIGMDDPSLAPRLQQTALDGDVEGGPEAAFTYHIEVDDPEPEAEPEIFSVEAEETGEEAEPTEEAVVVETKRPGFGASLFVVLTAAVFAAGGWQLALYLVHNPLTRISSTSASWGWQFMRQLVENPLNLASVTGVVGLLVGWLWVRWKYSRS